MAQHEKIFRVGIGWNRSEGYVEEYVSKKGWTNSKEKAKLFTDADASVLSMQLRDEHGPKAEFDNSFESNIRYD